MHWKQLEKQKSSVDIDEQTANTFPCASFGLYNVINDALLQIQACAVRENTEIQVNLQKIAILHRLSPGSGSRKVIRINRNF